jgi:vWA found in TerF C terminus
MTNDDLKKYDYVIMIDKSGSMSKPDCKNGISRWKHAQEQTENVARKCAEFDDDGIDVFVFANSVKEYHGATPEKVEQIFKENEPSGSTDTAGALKAVFDAYFSRKKAGSAKPLIIVCCTDGEPDSKEAVASVIIDATKKISSDEEIGLTFMQIGADPGAREFLKYLDDGLEAKGAKFDIVDCKDDSEMENLTMTELLIQAVTD